MRWEHKLIIAIILAMFMQLSVNQVFCQEKSGVPSVSRFVDNGDGSITDTRTKLIWQKGDNGKKVAFNEAQEYCRTLKLGNHTDWRLPKQDEYDTDVVTELMMPTHEQDGYAAGPFQVSADFYWSDDPTVRLPFNYPATHMTLSKAYGGNKDSKAYVRAVRDSL